MPNPQLYLFQTETIWFETYNEPCTSEHEATVSYTFDYEMLFDGTKRVYIDIQLKFQHAAILFRSGSEFDGAGLSWEDVFTHDFLYPIVKISVDTTYQGFAEECDDTKNRYKYGLEPNDDLPENIISNIIEQYTTYRSKDDAANAVMLNQIGLECESGTDTILVFKTTFTILDEVLFHHPRFNRKHNQEVFSDIVPIPRYLTIKFNCHLIEYDNVNLNLLDAIMFYQTLDCALQILVGDKADILIDAIQQKGITPDMQREYIKLGTELFAQLKEMLQASNATITNLESLKDWNSLIR